MRSIRTILFRWFSIVIVGLFLVTGCVLYTVTERLLTQFFIEDSSQALSFIAQNIRAHYDANLHALDTLSNLDGFSSLNLNRARGNIRHFLENDNFFGQVELYSIAGALLAADARASSAQRLVKGNLFNECDHRFVDTATQAIETGKPQLTLTFRCSSGAVQQAYMVPVFDAKHHVAALLTGTVYYEQHVRHFMEGLRLGDQNFLVLTDVAGNLLAQDGLDLRTDKAGSVPSLLQSRIQKASDAFYQSGDRKFDGAWLDSALLENRGGFLLLALPLNPFKLVLTMGASDKAVRHKQAILLRWMIAALAVVLVLSFFASGFVSSFLSKPFLQLIAAHDRLQRGDLAVRVQYDKNDEIGQLCDSFNRLSRKIEKARLLGNLWGKDSESSSKPS